MRKTVSHLIDIHSNAYRYTEAFTSYCLFTLHCSNDQYNDSVMSPSVIIYFTFSHNHYTNYLKYLSGYKLGLFELKVIAKLIYLICVKSEKFLWDILMKFMTCHNA